MDDVTEPTLGDNADDITEQDLIMFEDWDQERDEKVREYLLINMTRKVVYSTANGYLRTGGGYLSVEQYANAMTDRAMAMRQELRGLSGDARWNQYLSLRKGEK